MSIIYSKEQDGTLNVLVAGKVTREPEIKNGNNGNRVKFSVSYGKSKFMDCEAWADSSAGEAASCLEKGDVVGVMGTHRTWEYNGKQYSSLTADMIFPLAGAVAASEQTTPTTAPNESDLEDSDNEELPF